MDMPEKEFSDSLSTLPVPLRDICTEVIIQIHQAGSASSNLDEFINQVVNIIYNHFEL